MYTEKTRGFKNQVSASATLEQIEAYATKVLKGLVACILPPCPRCGLEPAWFKRHENRPRKFLVVIDQIVHVAACLLIRWKCPACGKTFTQYPDFALPRKRYTLPTILDLCAGYAEDENSTYRKTVRSSPAGYRDSEKQLEHSTVHRWLTSLNRLHATRARVADLILRKEPESNASRDAAGLSVGPAKYRSEARRTILERCRALFFFDAVYRSIFRLSIFPELATSCRYA
jgi:transposase-like protein